MVFVTIDSSTWHGSQHMGQVIEWQRDCKGLAGRGVIIGWDPVTPRDMPNECYVVRITGATDVRYNSCNGIAWVHYSQAQFSQEYSLSVREVSVDAVPDASTQDKQTDVPEQQNAGQHEQQHVPTLFWEPGNVFRCDCSCADKCPIGKTGLDVRCTEEDLQAVPGVHYVTNAAIPGTFDELRQQIGAWSKYNFGFNATRAFVVTSDSMVEINALGSLLGMMEEFGHEFHKAWHTIGGSGFRDEKAIWDAFADGSIYFADYCDRMGIDLSKHAFKVRHVESLEVSMQHVVQHVGKLSHCHLKMIQGIRGMDDSEFFHAQVLKACRSLYDWLESISQAMHRLPLVSIVNETWLTVRQRDWTKHKKDGGQA
jgi:hypothetical protein